jgi:hypothetical protein
MLEKVTQKQYNKHLLENDKKKNENIVEDK